MLRTRSHSAPAASEPEQTEATAVDSTDASGTALELGTDLSSTVRTPAEIQAESAKQARGTAEQRAAFDQKYSGKSRLELEMALGALSPVRRELQKSLIAKRRSAGLYTRMYPQFGESLNLTELGKTEADRAIPNPNGAHAGSVRGGDENGQHWIELVTIPHGTYPEFDELQAEELWLHEHVRKSN